MRGDTTSYGCRTGDIARLESFGDHADLHPLWDPRRAIRIQIGVPLPIVLHEWHY